MFLPCFHGISLRLCYFTNIFNFLADGPVFIDEGKVLEYVFRDECGPYDEGRVDLL